MNSTVKTRQITRGAIVCAIYGIMLFANQQFALAIEDGMSWIFAFPILIYAAQNPSSVAAVCAAAMALETFLFGGFTTWFYSWTSIVIGYLYGIGIYRRWSSDIKLVVTFLLSLGSYIFIFWIWAGIFGLDYAADFQMIHEILPFIDMRVFLAAIIFVLSLLQTICIHLLATLICIRMKIPTVPIKKISQLRPNKKVGIVSIVIGALFFLSQNVLQWNAEVKDIILIALMIDLCALDYYGILYMLDRSRCKAQRKRSFFAIFGAFIPGINAIWIILGELDCLFDLRKVRG